MPYRVIWEGEGCLVTFSGRPSDDELITLARACNRDDRFETARYVISDYLSCDRVSFSSSIAEELATIIHTPVVPNKGLKIALVADIPDIIALASAFISSSRFNGQEMRVFQVLDEARDWCKS